MKSPLIACTAAFALVVLAAPAQAQKGTFEKSFPFTGDKDVKIGYKYQDVTIESFRIRGWPDGDQMRKGEKDLTDNHSVSVEFTYSNRNPDVNYKCTYTIEVPGGPNGPYAKNDRTVTLDRGKIDDTNKVSLKMHTHQYKLAKSIKISLEVWRK